MIEGMRSVQPISAYLSPPLARFAYPMKAVRATRLVDVLHGLVPLAALSAIIVPLPFIDVLLPGVLAVNELGIL